MRLDSKIAARQDIHAGCRSEGAKLRRIIEGQEATIKAQGATIKTQGATIKTQVVQLAELTERLGLDSSNSHLPPSRDGNKARSKRKPKKKGKRKRGGQPGHKGKNPTLLPPDKVDRTVRHVPENCGGCGGSLRNKPNAGDSRPTRHQVIELPKKLYEVVEHQCEARVCGACGELTRAVLPVGVPRTCTGPKLQAFSALLSAHFRCSKRKVQEFFSMVFSGCGGISLGTVSNHEKLTSAALAGPYKEAVEAIARQDLIHSDETSWPEEGVGRYLYSWTAVASRLPLTAFLIARRTRQAFEGFLSGFKGTAHVDRYGSYAHMGDRRCFCWAHLKRDFKRVEQRGGLSKKIAKVGLRVHRDLFKAWHRFEAGEFDREGLRAALRPLESRLRPVLQEGAARKGSKKHGKTAGFCQNLLDDWACLWRFAEIEGGRPTNNAAERSVRHGVILRKTSFGTQSKRGSRFIERMLTAIETCRRQKRDVFAYLTAACEAALFGEAAPSLLPPEMLALAAPT